MDDRTPRGVIQEKLDHYTEIFAHKEPRDAPKKKTKKQKKKPRYARKRILVYGQPGK